MVVPVTLVRALTKHSLVQTLFDMFGSFAPFSGILLG